MENNNKTFTFTDREILLLFVSVGESLSSYEESLDDCYSYGDLERLEQLKNAIEELNALSRRFIPYINVDSIFDKSKVGD